MKILLTGCDGQVGCEVRKQASDYGFEILATDVGDLDITDIDAIRLLQQQLQADLFINSAAYTAVDQAESDVALAHAVNADGAGNLALVAAENDIPMLHISTDYVFDGSATTPYPDQATPNPQTVYGKTKLAGELLVAENNAQHLTLRTSWVFGIEGQNFVKTMLRLARANNELRVIADQFGSPTFAGHIARALLQLAKRLQHREPVAWGTYNFCDAGPTTWHTFATRIVTRGFEQGLLESVPVVIPLRTQEYPTAAKRPTYSVMDCSRFNRHFPEIGIQSWDEGLSAMLAALSLENP